VNADREAVPGEDVLDLHATTVVVGEEGILIRGPSGSGKTRLALAIVAEARRSGRFARIVADDRTRVSARGDRLVARPHPRLAGFVERRGLGVLAVEHEPAAVLRLVVDLQMAGWPARLPELDDLKTVMAGAVLHRLPVAGHAPTSDAVALVCEGLAALTTSS
jgi:serine kinase of HPr protein (carbohydrate metabolism regulator)